MAALTHFFYLAAFCLMLVEGIQILVSVTYVFRERRYRDTYLLVAAAWGNNALTSR